MLTEISPNSSEPSVPENRFITGFLIPHHPKLDELNEVEAEISFERSGWQSSGALEDLVAEFEIGLNEAGIPNRLSEANFRRNLVRNAEFSIYGSNESSGRPITSFMGKEFRLLPFRAQIMVRDYDQAIRDHRGQFCEAVGPLITKQKWLGDELTETWHAFVTASPSQLSDFLDFLANDDFEEMRDDNRPFLQALRRSESLVGGVTKALIAGLLANPDAETLSQFITQNFILSTKDSTARDWLTILSYPDSSINPEVIAERICVASLLPRDLRQQFRNYLVRLLSPNQTRLQALLEPYRIREPKLNLGLTHKFERQPTGIKTQVAVYHEESKGELEMKERPRYSLVVIRRGEPVELVGSLRSKFIVDTARRFSQSDYMISAIEAIVDSLQNDPWGLGVGKLTAYTVSSLDCRKTLPLRRYRADRRPTILPKNSDELEEVKRLRAVFYFDKTALPDTIILDEILHHQDFDVKYSS